MFRRCAHMVAGCAHQTRESYSTPLAVGVLSSLHDIGQRRPQPRDAQQHQ